MGIGDWAAMGNMGNGHEFILSQHSLSENNLCCVTIIQINKSELQEKECSSETLWQTH